MKIVTAPGVTYVVYAAAGATVTCPDRPDPLLTCAGGEPNYFTAPGAEVEISDDSAAIAACRNIKFEVSGGGGSGGSGGSGGGEWTDIRPLSNTWTGTNSFNGMVRFASGIDCMGAAYIRADLHKTINSNTLTSTSVLNMGEADGRYALKGEGGGGVEISFDTSPTKDSSNAVTSGGLYKCFFETSKLTLGQGSSGHGTVYSLGSNNTLMYGSLGVAVGFSNNVGGRQQYGAFGQNNKLSGNRTWAFGAGNVMNDDACGCVCLCASDSGGNTFTQFYFMAANSTLATTYEAGEACMGYVTKDKSGNILAAGTQKLSALFPNNSTFAPALANEFGEFETPKVFMPSGATEPIELDPLINL